MRSCSDSLLLVSSSIDTLFISKSKSFVLIFSLAMSSESTCQTGVWNGIDGSSNVDICLTCLLSAKSFNFLGNPFVNISLFLRFMVAAFSLHHPFLTKCCTLRAKWRTVSSSFFMSDLASTCA